MQPFAAEANTNQSHRTETHDLSFISCVQSLDFEPGRLFLEPVTAGESSSPVPGMQVML